MLREHLVKTWDAKVATDIEADDAVAIEFNPPDGKVLCHIDKDLLQCPGAHYDYGKQSHYVVSELDACKAFYIQLLSGDKIDNVPNLRKGFGKKHAEWALNNCTSEDQFLSVVKELFEKEYGPDNYQEILTLRGQLLKIKRTADESLWQIKIDTAQV